ncbi:MAG: MFS transporter [Acidimicrobiia bacterium]|nr:ATP-binding protein [bacterium]MXW59601.1 MFS transporter [Acidimicrobiia bacterium]MXZ77908.1 MFS transporter [Acidimicrobiia bacterium]MXZ86620.1 MFS transporter [Acidimicrobiia bacterium]MYB11515.1 MFS transporter [Acidimicrobiia bacterium]
MSDSSSQSAATSLSSAILSDEEARADAAKAAKRDVLYEDAALPGVGAEEVSLRDGLRRGGMLTFGTLAAIEAFDELEGAALSLLGPDIANTFGVSDGTITFITAASAAFYMLGAAPMGWMADRMRRIPIVAIATITFAFFSFATGLAVSAFMLFWLRFGAGIAKANSLTIHPALLADAYPIAIRGRMYAMEKGISQVAATISPILVGAVATAAGGDEGWRWAYLIFSIPIAVMGFFALRIPEPERGQWEKREVLGRSLKSEEGMDISAEAAFARIWRIDTIRYMTIALVALGFALFPAGSIQSFFLEEEFGLDAWERGLAISPTALGLLLFLPLIGKRFDRTFKRDPNRALRILGALLFPLTATVPIQYFMPNVYLFVVWGVVNGTLLGASFSMIGPAVQTVLPYRLRSMGMAIIMFFMFVIGAVGGGLLASFLQDEIGERSTIISVTVIAMPLGAFYIMRGASRMRRDLSLVVSELKEEEEEQQRRAQPGATIPALQLHNIDFSYGQVQVLFDLSFEVQQGETLALLGTNGAGKSTALRVVTGLNTPERGIIRLGGRTITFATPEQRVAMGIQMLPGGGGVFRSMTIGDNILVGAGPYRRDRAALIQRLDYVFELFPMLKDRQHELAGDLSGGQQQMLALARVMLHQPKILLIDELSLGLAPSVVAELLELVESLKSAGQTMIVVEQSLNVALSIAERAIFLEKGEVRFEGRTADLVGRDDIARAVFLGDEGG